MRYLTRLIFSLNIKATFFLLRKEMYGSNFFLSSIKLSISKALVENNPDFRSDLKKAGLLTRDSRVKERKKVGLKKARKSPQFSKR